MKLQTLLLISLTLATGCARRSTLESAVTDLARAKAEVAPVQAEVALGHKRVEARDSQLESLSADKGAVEAERTQFQSEVARQQAEVQQAQAELRSTQAMLRQRGAEREDLMRRINELAAVEREAARRNEIYQQVLGRFKSLIDAGQLRVAIVRGRLVLQLPQDILFASGRAELGEVGVAALTQVGQVLATFTDREFQVEGHTDNVPIRTSQFPSNWELSAARALAVVHLMITSGVAPEHISAAGYGEFQPRAANDTPENKQLNRRIEIVMIPNLDILQNSEAPQ